MLIPNNVFFVEKKYEEKKVRNKKNTFSVQLLFATAVMLVIAVGGLLALSISNKSQDNRSDASVGNNQNAGTFFGVKTTPLYSMSKTRTNPKELWDVNHLLESTDYSRLVSIGYRAYGEGGVSNQPIGCIISPEVTEQQLKNAKLEGLVTPLYRAVFPEDPQNHIHYFDTPEAPMNNPYEPRPNFERLIGYVFNQDISFDAMVPTAELCRFEFPSELARGIKDDFVTLCKEEQRLRNIRMGNNSSLGITGVYYQKNPRGLVNGDRLQSVNLTERPLYVLAASECGRQIRR